MLGVYIVGKDCGIMFFKASSFLGLLLTEAIQFLQKHELQMNLQYFVTPCPFPSDKRPFQSIVE